MKILCFFYKNLRSILDDLSIDHSSFRLQPICRVYQASISASTDSLEVLPASRIDDGRPDDNDDGYVNTDMFCEVAITNPSRIANNRVLFSGLEREPNKAIISLLGHNRTLSIRPDMVRCHVYSDHLLRPGAIYRRHGLEYD